jgi:hypothetical protein
VVKENEIRRLKKQRNKKEGYMEEVNPSEEGKEDTLLAVGDGVDFSVKKKRPRDGIPHRFISKVL